MDRTAFAVASGPAAIRKGPPISHPTKATTCSQPRSSGPLAAVVGQLSLFALGHGHRHGDRALPTVRLFDLAARDAEQEQDGVEVRHAQRGVGGATHHRLGVEGDAEAGGGQHVDVVGAVAHRNRPGHRDAGGGGEANQGLRLAGPVHDGTAQLARQDATVEHELVGRQVVDAEVP